MHKSGAQCAKVSRWLNAAVVDPQGDGACFSTIALQQSMWPTIRPSSDRAKQWGDYSEIQA
jgi:hypothetical protein